MSQLIACADSRSSVLTRKNFFFFFFFRERFGEADRLVAESKNSEALQALQALEKAGGPVDAELLWRLGRAFYLVGENSKENEVVKENVEKADEYIQKALATPDADKNANIQKWAAITLGKLGDFTDTKTKISNSFKIKVGEGKKKKKKKKKKPIEREKKKIDVFFKGTRFESY